MGKTIRHIIKLLSLLLAILLVPGQVELAGAAFSEASDGGLVATSIDHDCCDKAVSTAAHTESREGQEGCAPACDHCWCCGSLPAVPSLMTASTGAPFLIYSVRQHALSPQGPPARPTPPPVRPPIL